LHIYFFGQKQTIFFQYSPPQDLVGGDAGEGVKALYLKIYPLTSILSHKRLCHNVVLSLVRHPGENRGPEKALKSMILDTGFRRYDGQKQ
jgi:hypothetical protein